MWNALGGAALALTTEPPFLQRPSCAAFGLCWQRLTLPGRHPGLAGSPTTPPTPAHGSMWSAGSSVWFRCEPDCPPVALLQLLAADAACPHLPWPCCPLGPLPPAQLSVAAAPCLHCLRCRRVYEDRRLHDEVDGPPQHSHSMGQAAGPLVAPAPPPGAWPWGPLIPELAQLDHLRELEMQRFEGQGLSGAIPPEWGRAGAFPRLRK